MDQKKKKFKGSENHQLLYERLVALQLDDLRTQSKASFNIISKHLSTFSGIIKMRYRKGSKEHKTAVKAHNDGVKALKEIEKAVRIMDDILKTLYKRKRI